MAKFDTAVYAKTIETLTIEEIQNRIEDIDARTKDDLYMREALVARRTELFKEQSPDGEKVQTKNWIFGLVQKRFPFFPSILKKDLAVGTRIVQKHPEMLSVSKKDLEKVLVEMGLDEKAIESFVKDVSTDIRPYVSAKRLR